MITCCLELTDKARAERSKENVPVELASGEQACGLLSKRGNNLIGKTVGSSGESDLRSQCTGLLPDAITHGLCPREEKGGARPTIWSWPGEKWLAEKGGDSESVVLKVYADRDRVERYVLNWSTDGSAHRPRELCSWITVWARLGPTGVDFKLWFESSQ